MHIIDKDDVEGDEIISFFWSLVVDAGYFMNAHTDTAMC